MRGIGTTVGAARNRAVFLWEAVGDTTQHSRWGPSGPILGACMTCTGTSGNGVWTGGKVLFLEGASRIPRGGRRARTACFEGAVGATMAGTAGRRSATTPSGRTSARTVSGSVRSWPWFSELGKSRAELLGAGPVTVVPGENLALVQNDRLGACSSESGVATKCWRWDARGIAPCSCLRLAFKPRQGLLAEPMPSNNGCGNEKEKKAIGKTVSCFLFTG